MLQRDGNLHVLVIRLAFHSLLENFVQLRHSSRWRANLQLFLSARSCSNVFTWGIQIYFLPLNDNEELWNHFLYLRASTLLFRTITLLFSVFTLLFLAYTLLFLAFTLLFLAITLLFRAFTLLFRAFTLLFRGFTVPRSKDISWFLRYECNLSIL